MLKVGVISMKNLPEMERKYLLSLEDEGKSIPVYYRDGEGNVFFVQDFELKDNKTFEKTAPNSLYRGGALLSLKTDEGMAVLGDERHNWRRLVGGIARFNEGADLTKTAIREGVVEELVVTSRDRTTRFFPKGMSLDILEVPEWKFEVEKIEEVGEIIVLDYFFNEVNHAFEAVVEWAIPGKLLIFHDEDWWDKSRSGIVVWVIDQKGEPVGVYSGQQGFMPKDLKIHPTLQSVLKL